MNNIYTNSANIYEVEIDRLGSPFYATRKMFRMYTGYEEPLSFEEWVEIPEDSRAAVLFVQFFDQITLAWEKCKSFYTLEEDGVSTVLQYLQKNVPIIENDPNRFSPRYIYKVAYNCMYCICHDIKRERDRWENECSNIKLHGEEELDLFDIVCSRSTDDIFCSDEFKERFWDIIEDMDKDTKTVVRELLQECGKSSRISEERRKGVICNLRDALSEFIDVFGF